MNNREIIEISDTVYKLVMNTIRKEINECMPQFIQNVTVEVKRKVELEYGNKIKNLEDKIRQLENQNIVARKEIVYQAKTINNVTTKIDMSKQSIRLGHKFNGWIFYANDEMGDFLYKVRTDGSENTKLTDYDVCSYFSIKNRYLYFGDGELKDQKIKIG